MAKPRTFSNVEIYAVQYPDHSRTVQSDLSVLEEDLPGMLELGFVVDGVRVPLLKRKAAGVLADIERHKTATQPDVEQTD